MEVKHYIGQHNGISFTLQYGRMCDVGAWDSAARRWFLSSPTNHADDYIGDFATQREAMEEIDRQSKGD